ncbi:MAG: hypothetical protein J5626_07570 [Lachnospiraceae bacterium]|nr:hypothetical protein [Lachnospiraceae bacterium]
MAKDKKSKFNIALINNRKFFLYVVLLGLVCFLAFYMLVYKEYEQKTNLLRSENSSLRNKVNELKEVYDNMEAYESSIEYMGEEINKILSDYPADVRDEDAIVVAVETLNKAYVEYTTINIHDKEELGAVSAETVSKAGLADYSGAIGINKRAVSYVNRTDYGNLKAIIGTILDYGGKKVIDKISYSKNEDEKDGYITGTIEVIDYIADGTGAEYVAPDIKEYEAGLYDIFGIVKNPNAK